MSVFIIRNLNATLSGLKEGKKEGLREGEMNKATKILLQSRVDINIISQSSGLTIEEIKELTKK